MSTAVPEHSAAQCKAKPHAANESEREERMRMNHDKSACKNTGNDEIPFAVLINGAVQHV